MNFQQGIFDLEALISNQRPTAPSSNFQSSMRPLQYSTNLPKEPQNFQNPMAFYQGRQNTNDNQMLGMFDSAYNNRREENLRYPFPNNDSNILEYMQQQQRKGPSNMQYLPANPQIPPLKSERSKPEDVQGKRNIRPQSLNGVSNPRATNIDLINLESDESLAQLLQSSRMNRDFRMPQQYNTRHLSYNDAQQNEDALAQALLLNSLNYGKNTADSLLSQLPGETNMYGINELDVLGSLNPLLFSAMCANTNIDNLYKQMQRELLMSGLQQEQPMLPLLTQQSLQSQHSQQSQQSMPPEPMVKDVKPKKAAPIKAAEPILIDDSPESDFFMPNPYNAFERKAVKEEFTNKISKPYQGYEGIEDRRMAGMNGMTVQNLEGSLKNKQSLNGKRPLPDKGPQMQLYGSPEKRFETNVGKDIRVTPNIGVPQKQEIKNVKKDTKKPVQNEKMALPLTLDKLMPMTDRNSFIQQMPAETIPQPLVTLPDPKKFTNEMQEIKKNNINKQVDMMNSKTKEPVFDKKPAKITIEKISLPEISIPQQEVLEPQLKVKQSPTMLHLHKNQGQIQITPQNVEQSNKNPLQVKLVSASPMKVEPRIELQAPLLDEKFQAQEFLVNPLIVNQSPEKIAAPGSAHSLLFSSTKEEDVSTSDDILVYNKEKSSVRKKKPEPAAEATAAEQSGKRERKPNKLQMMRVAYQTYLEEMRKPYKISIHVDPTNPDEKIVSAKVGEGYQVDVEAVLTDPKYMKKRPIVSVWNPDSISPKMLEEYYTKFGQIIGQKITHEEAALKNLEKFEMDVEKALDNAKRNRLYYQNYFRLDQRVLRTRATYVA